MATSRSSEPWNGAVSIDVTAATQWILDQIEPLPATEMPVHESLGLVLAADAVADGPFPAFDTSAMDGYALRRRTGSFAGWTVIGRSMAGHEFPGRLGDGEAVRIMTGARVPSGADTVAPLEAATECKGVVTIATEVTAGSHIRRKAEDHDVGDVIIARGTRLTPIHLAVLASIGHDRPQAVRRPRVGVISTGDEVVHATSDGSGIRDTNRPGLIALLAGSGVTPVDLGAVGDDAGELTRRLDHAVRECDAVITTGGVSVGDHDLVKLILAQAAHSTRGVARWMRVAVRPAKPLMFATVGHVPVFGLPGNPASAFVSYHLFARPAIDRLAGRPDAGSSHSFTATAAVELPRRRDGRLHVVPVVTDISNATLRIRPAGTLGRHNLAATAGADAYAYLPDGPSVPAGATVDCGWIAGGRFT